MPDVQADRPFVRRRLRMFSRRSCFEGKSANDDLSGGRPVRSGRLILIVSLLEQGGTGEVGEELSGLLDTLITWVRTPESERSSKRRVRQSAVIGQDVRNVQRGGKTRRDSGKLQKCEGQEKRSPVGT